MTTDLVRMSHSRFNEYAECGERYRLRRIEKAPETPSIYAIAGTLFHEWSERYDLHPEHTWTDANSWADRLCAAVNDAVSTSGIVLERWDDPSRKPVAQYERFRDEHGPAWIESYKQWRQTTGWTIPNDARFGFRAAVEFTVEYTLGTVRDIAIIDRIFETPQGLVAVDLKTWSRRRNSPQLATYTVALRQYGLPVTHACYYEARKGTHTEPYDYTHWDVDRLRALHEQAAYMIRDGYFLAAPGDQCSTCPVRRNCRFAV